MDNTPICSKEILIHEISSTEWNSRKLSRYGFFAWLIDIVLIAAIFAAMENIAFSILPGVPLEQAQFWLAFQVILFITFMKKIFNVWDPLNHYQTLIIRQ